MMNLKYLPSDLRKVSVTQKIKRILFLVLFVVLLGGIYSFLNLKNSAEKISIAVLLLFLLLVVCGKSLPMLIDKSFWGEVTRVTIKTGVDMDWMFKRPWLQPRRNTVILEIQLPNGKQISRQVYYENAQVHSKQENLSLHIEKYNVGDCVFHLSGTEHTVVFPKPSNTKMQCSVCGSFSDVQEKYCSYCNHTLVKSMPAE